MNSPSESRSSPFAPPGESLGRQVTPLDTWRAAALRSKQSMDAVSSAHANIDHCFVIIFSDLLSKYRRIGQGGLSLGSGSARAVSLPGIGKRIRLLSHQKRWISLAVSGLSIRQRLACPTLPPWSDCHLSRTNVNYRSSVSERRRRGGGRGQCSPLYRMRSISLAEGHEMGGGHSSRGSQRSSSIAVCH